MTAARKPAPKRKAAARKAAAAAAEKAPAATTSNAGQAEPTATGKTIQFKDLTLQLPDKLPVVTMFDVVEMEATSEDNPVPMIRLLRTLLGGEQFTQVRHRIPAGDNDTETAFRLIADCLALYGVSLGE